MSKIARPEGHHSITPAAVVSGAGKVLAFVEKAFGGKVVDRYDGPDGVVYHAEIKVGDSVLFVGDPTPESPPMPAALSHYVDDGVAVDAAYRRALDAGANSLSEPANMPWGYRAACVTDPGGNRWTICAIVEELTHEEIERRMMDTPKG